MDSSFDDVWAECEDLFSQARGTLAALKEPKPAHIFQGSVNALFRATHTLKGMAGMLGFPHFRDAAHRLEDLFDLLRKGRLRSSDSLIETLEAGLHALESGMEGLRRGRPEPEDYLHSLRRELGEMEALAHPIEGVGRDLTSILDLSPEALKALSDYERTRVTAVLLAGMTILGLKVSLAFSNFDERLRSLGGALSEWGELISTLPWEGPDAQEGLTFLLIVAGRDFDPDRFQGQPNEQMEVFLLADGRLLPEGLRTEQPQAVPAELPAEAPLAAAQPLPTPEGEILRLPAHRVEALEARLMLLGQLRDAANLLLRESGNAQLEPPMVLLDRMEDGLLEVQKSLLQMRMVKVETLFNRLEPMVRSLSRDLGKPVKLTFVGGDLEVERNLLGHLVDPFLHLIRNALDHGLEPPSERLAQGKAEIGSIRITASQLGRNLRFDIRDDGRGFDLSRIASRALALGLITAGEAYSQEHLHLLTLEPGFSTQEKASLISGRGVGMDIVKAELESMGGEVKITSEPRRGSRVRLSLPLTRAVVSCLKVRCAGFSFGFPLSSVLRVQAGREAIHGGDQVLVHGKTLPLESLQACLGLPSPEDQRAFVVLAQQGSAEHRVEIAVGVDEVEGRGDVLLRSLPEMAQAPGIMGGSPQEDGILWVIDPRSVVALAMDSLMRRLAHV